MKTHVVKVFYNEKISFNINQISFLIFFSSLYVAVMVANLVLTKKWISIGSWFVFGGSFVSPFLFILSDVIAEVYGLTVARMIILFGFLCQTIFCFIVNYMISTPPPTVWDGANSYKYVFESIIRINFSGCIAYFVSSRINVKVITRWKVILNGSYFWVRSIGSSIVAECVYSFISIFMISFGKLNFNLMIVVIILTFLIKVFFSILFCYPGDIFVRFVKNKIGLDIYEKNTEDFYKFGKHFKKFIFKCFN